MHKKRFLYAVNLHEPLVRLEALMVQGSWKSHKLLKSYITIGDTAFPHLSWLVKSYNENRRDPRQRYFNKMLCNARIVSECTYKMTERRWDILCKKTEAQPVISSWRALHNITCASQEISGANLAGSWKFNNLILYKLFLYVLKNFLILRFL